MTTAHYEMYQETLETLDLYEQRQENLNEACASMPLLLDILEELGDNGGPTCRLYFFQLFTIAHRRAATGLVNKKKAAEHMRALHLAFSGGYPINGQKHQRLDYDVYDRSYLPFLVSYMRSL